ncbi:peptide chain release factor 1 [Roseomonas sp. PWR1]|uniref:Peptide chain release factor 1 n=1 Tax=Roseomonas nitratireducens TaxID=2820810 RepID=A0ABS4AMA3_9PROT|nr:peptide chain release factor 1 [Neoroseomonas nitratireducens]MBP0462486.1 peptide chain release factor 1 [Neoroseomonas nitratireducens]
MSEAEYERRLAELDRLLNDPEVRLDADRVWALLAEMSRVAAPRTAPATP